MDVVEDVLLGFSLPVLTAAGFSLEDVQGLKDRRSSCHLERQQAGGCLAVPVAAARVDNFFSIS